jgi:hypothetical protein
VVLKVGSWERLGATAGKAAAEQMQESQSPDINVRTTGPGPP